MISRLRIRYFVGGVAVCYLAVLTLCLVARNPFWVAGHREGTLRWMFEQYVAPVSHLLSFFVAGLLCGLGCSRSTWGIVLGALAFYGVATEAIQALVPGRMPEWADVLQNTVGLGLGMGLAIWLRRRGIFVPRPKEPAPV